MKNEDKVYKCPKCQKNKMTEKEFDNFTEYECQSCGYNYKVYQPKQNQRQSIQVFDLLQKNAWVLAIIAIILAVSLYPVISGQVGDANNRINYVGNTLSNDIEDNSDDISTLKGNLTVLKNNINSMDTLLNVIELNLGQLIGLDEIVSKLKHNVTNIEDNITEINEFLEDIDEDYDLQNSVGNLTFTFYQNQTNVTNYCHLNISVKNYETDLADVKFGIQYDYTNISLMVWDGLIKPQEYQWTNGSYKDNYYLQWFERGNSFYALYNITWSYSDYNSTQIDTADIKENIMVNGYLVDDMEIYEKDGY